MPDNHPKSRGLFFENYDLYETEGVSGAPKDSPGAGFYQNMDKYKSVEDFLKKKRKKRKKLLRKAIFSLLLKTAEDNDNLDSPLDQYEQFSQYETDILPRIIKSPEDLDTPQELTETIKHAPPSGMAEPHTIETDFSPGDSGARTVYFDKTVEENKDPDTDSYPHKDCRRLKEDKKSIKNGPPYISVDTTIADGLSRGVDWSAADDYVGYVQNKYYNTIDNSNVGDYGDSRGNGDTGDRNRFKDVNPGI